MASTIRSHKALVTKKNQIVLAWLEESSQFLQTVRQTSTQQEHSKELALAVSMCDEYLQLLEVSLTKLTEAFDKLEDTTDEDEDNIDKYIEGVDETIVGLHAHRSNLKKTLQEDDTGSTHGSSGPNDHSSAVANKLPAIPIPTFTGRKWEWDNFWALYKANVHDQDLSQLQKFNYLLTSLSGEAKQSIARFYVSANNYDKAIQHLVKRYGNKECIVLELNKSLHSCVARGPSTMEQRQLWDRLSTIAAQLEEHEQHLDNQLTVQIFLQKFHTRIRRAAMERKLRQRDEHKPEWTVDQWLDAIDDIISQEEQLNHMLSAERRIGEHSLHKATTFRATPQSKENWKTTFPCERCGNKGHRWNTCPQIPTAKQKRRFLIESNRCLNCGSANHRLNACPSGNCRKCHKKHHTSTCIEDRTKEAESSGKSKQHAVTRDTKKEITQGTFAIDEGTSRTFGPGTAITLLLRRRHIASSSWQFPSNSDATVKRTLSEDNSAKVRTKRQATSNVSSHSLESDQVKPLVKKALVTATSAMMATTNDKKFPPCTELDLNTDAPIKTALTKEYGPASKEEVITIHRLWEDFLDFKKKVERQHQELQEWMQSMKRFSAFTTQERTNIDTKEKIHNQQEKSIQVASHNKTQSSERIMQSKNEVKGRHVKNRRHREISPTTSQRRSNTTSSLQKEISSKKRRRNTASPSGKTLKKKERRLNSLDDQRRQAPARGKDAESQKRFKAKRSVTRSAQARVYELRSHHPTSPSQRGAKHSNVSDMDSDVRHRQIHKHEYTRKWIEETYDQAAKQMLIERKECTKSMKAELDSQLEQLQQKISCLEQQLLGLGAQFKEETERRGRENSEFLNQLMDEISKEGPGHRSEVLREDRREHRRSRSREQVSPENRRRERKRSQSTVGSRTRKESFNDRREHHQGEGRKRKHSERKTDRRQHYEELLASYEEELEKTRTELRQISCPTRQIGDGGLKTGQNIMCIFCKEFGQHYSDGCPRIISITDRIAILDNEGRCHRCLERHLNACPRQTSCFYCKNVGRSTAYDHHAGICPLPDEMDRLRSRQRELEESVQNYRRELQLITHDRSTVPMEDYPGPSHS